LWNVSVSNAFFATLYASLILMSVAKSNPLLAKLIIKHCCAHSLHIRVVISSIMVRCTGYPDLGSCDFRHFLQENALIVL
jgi:hypothetical protein